MDHRQGCQQLEEFVVADGVPQQGIMGHRVAELSGLALDEVKHRHRDHQPQPAELCECVPRHGQLPAQRLHLLNPVQARFPEARTSTVFGDPNLVSSAGVVPMLALTDRAGLQNLADWHLRCRPTAGQVLVRLLPRLSMKAA